MLAALRDLGWIVCVIYATIPLYWLLIHPRTAFWHSQKSPFRILLPFWIAMWGVFTLITMNWRAVLLYSALWTWLPAGALFSLGISLYAQAGGRFKAAQLSGLPELVSSHEDQRLVTTGIRARVRHPIYLAHLCEMLAWSLGTGLAVCYGLTVFAMLSGALMIRLEERELERRFGEPYRAYRKAVPAIFPRIFG
jgi:protein-S-isoprenylcysteine O-methyltransferase Ste14